METLEKQTTKKTVESVVYVKKSQLSDNEKPDGFSDQPLPEIEARVSNKDVLIRIHCLKQKGFAVRILGEIEKLRLSVVNSSVLPFGDYVMDITVVAQAISFSLTFISFPRFNPSFQSHEILSFFSKKQW